MRGPSGEVAPYCDCGRERVRASGEPGGEATIMLRGARKGCFQGRGIDQTFEVVETTVVLSCGPVAEKRSLL